MSVRVLLLTAEVFHQASDNMGEMKDDMAGAGAVLGALRAIAALKIPCNVMGIIACAENMPSGSAQRPEML